MNKKNTKLKDLRTVEVEVYDNLVSEGSYTFQMEVDIENIQSYISENDEGQISFKYTKRITKLYLFDNSTTYSNMLEVQNYPVDYYIPLSDIISVKVIDDE